MGNYKNALDAACINDLRNLDRVNLVSQCSIIVEGLWALLFFNFGEFVRKTCLSASILITRIEKIKRERKPIWLHEASRAEDRGLERAKMLLTNRSMTLIKTAAKIEGFILLRNCASSINFQNIWSSFSK